MNEMQQYLVEDRIHALEHEAERLRAERARNRQTTESRSSLASAPAAAPAAAAPTASASFAVAPVTIDPVPSTRVRLGRWLVGVGAAIAGATVEETDAGVRSAAATHDGAAFAAFKAANGTCEDGSSPLSHAA